MSDFLSKLRAHHWHLLGFWKGSPLYLSLERAGQARRYYKVNGIDFELRNNPAINGEASYMDVAEEQKLISLLTGQAKNSEFLEQHARACNERIQEIREFADTHAGASFVSREALRNAFASFEEVFKRNMPFIYTVYYLTDILETHARSIFHDENFPFAEQDALLASLAEPERMDFVREEAQALAHIAHQFATEPTTDIPLLEQHRAIYSWMNVYSFLGEPYPLSYYEARMRQRATSPSSAHKKEVPAFVRNYAHFFAMLKEYAYLRTMRYDIFNYAFARLAGLFSSLAVALNIPADDVVYLISEEIQEGLAGKAISIEEIRRRKAGFSVMLLDGELSVVSGAEHVALASYFSQIQNESTAKEEERRATPVIGQSGFRGVYNGRVKVIMKNADFLKLEKGDVLVARMVPLDAIDKVQLCGAFVTDLGGILSHAAIISRELKKPCIIGTKIATQVLKDGDEVEVDADHGIVKILKRAS